MSAVLPAVDRASFVVALGQRLRDAGVPVTFTSLAAFTDALEVAPPERLTQLYWLARVTLLSQPHDLDTFDAVFDAAFRDSALNVRERAGVTTAGAAHQEEDVLVPVAGDPDVEQEGDGLPWHTLPRTAAPDGGDAGGALLPELLPSGLEAMADTPFEQLDERELALVGAWLERSLPRWPMRLSRRNRVHGYGRRVALRETIARSRRTGWEAIELSRYRPVLRPRAVTLLADVSQSMQSYSTAYLHLMRAMARSGRAETFVFSTSLTRLTPALRQKSAEQAIEQATEQVVDRYGGTHLATSLRSLLTSRHGNALRGGVLVVASDGWDSDDPERLAAVMRRIRLRVHRVVWLNPRAGAPGFAPLVASMAAALPYCDAFLPAHNVRAMTEALDAILVD